VNHRIQQFKKELKNRLNIPSPELGESLSAPLGFRRTGVAGIYSKIYDNGSIPKPTQDFQNPLHSTLVKNFEPMSSLRNCKNWEYQEQAIFPRFYFLGNHQ